MPGSVRGLITSFANRILIERWLLPMDVARDHLMIPMAVTLLLLIPIARTDAPESAETAGTDSFLRRGGGLCRGAAGWRVTPGRAVTTAFVLAAASGICLESLFYWILTLNASGGTGFVQLLASLSIWMNGASLVLAAGAPHGSFGTSDLRLRCWQYRRVFAREVVICLWRQL